MPRTATASAPTATQVADLLLAPGADYNQLTRQFIADLGWPAARLLLAEAHGIASERLFADAA
ncbi:hypothetical protein ACFYPN_16125 [Streptomyces sp. NPDC005576]|uniref:hypothetical protein n=1 Tax=unclassified Streptomyces TaxID=2593676 RepID=UPI0033FE8BBB